jgi:hypothetical protein
LWEPYFIRKSEYSSFHNTDPFIFDGFYYSNCRQSASPGLRQLGRGSVIVFGSGQGHGWVVDTVLVVADSVAHTAASYEQSLRGTVSDAYFDITLRPTWDNQGNGGEEFRLYRGATFDSPVNNMFSFFPCMAAGGRVGFPRPTVRLPDRYFTATNRQAAKGCAPDAQPHDPFEVEQLWQSLLDQVRRAGLCPGIAASMPPERGHS